MLVMSTGLILEVNLRASILCLQIASKKLHFHALKSPNNFCYPPPSLSYLDITMRLKLSTICPTCKKTLTLGKTRCDTIALNAGSRLERLSWTLCPPLESPMKLG